MMNISGADLELAQVLIALVLLGLSMVCLPVAYRVAWQRLSHGERRWIAGAMVVGAVLRWLVAPSFLAMIFIGYKQTEHALTLLPLSHYGVGATAFYHALFGVLPSPDHRTMIAINATVGVLTLPLLGAWAGRLLRDGRAGVIAAWLVALTPLFIRNDVSEANNVPTLWWFIASMVLLDAWARSGRLSLLAAATPLLTLAAIARPEMPLLIALALPLFAIASGWPAARFKPTLALVSAALVIIALTLPHVAHILNAMDTLSDRASLPGLKLEEVSRLPRMVLWERNVTLRPDLFPIAVSALGLIALLLGRGQRIKLGALTLAALISLTLYVVDLDEANIARVQVPGALFITLLGASGAAQMWRARWCPQLLARVPIAVALASAIPTASALWAPANEHTEEALIQEASAALPTDAPFTLLRLGEGDRRDRGQDSRFTHYHFPDYLFRPPTNDGVLRSLNDFIDEPEFGVATYFFQGMRCYAEFRSPGVPAPLDDDMHPACAAIHERFELEPVFERDVENYGDVWIRYYGGATSLRVGLYRVQGPR
ncbi:MAG: hypothetical protein ACPGU1_13415 [Myxococcota bacterium]